MARLNWSRTNARNLMARRGVEGIRGDMPFGMPKPRGPYRRPPSKAEMRAQTANLVDQYRGTVTLLPTVVDLKCRCGHQASIRLPRARKEYRLRCSHCGDSQSWSPAAREEKRGDAS
jgi:hypothetical protein